MKIKLSKSQWEEMGKMAGWWGSLSGEPKPELKENPYIESQKWWRSLSNNQQDDYSKKYFPNIRRSNVYRMPRLIKEIHEKEGTPPPQSTIPVTTDTTDTTDTKMITPKEKFLVVDDEFNRANYPHLIDKTFSSPPSYAHVKVVVARTKGVMKSAMTPESKTHKNFSNKKEALSFLQNNALMSVGWNEGEDIVEACFFNGKIHITRSKGGSKVSSSASNSYKLSKISSVEDL